MANRRIDELLTRRAGRSEFTRLLAHADSRDMREAFQALDDNELEVVLAGQDLTVYFSKTHIIDLKAVLAAEASLPAEAEDQNME